MKLKMIWMEKLEVIERNMFYFPELMLRKIINLAGEWMWCDNGAVNVHQCDAMWKELTNNLRSWDVCKYQKITLLSKRRRGTHIWTFIIEYTYWVWSRVNVWDVARRLPHHNINRRYVCDRKVPTLHTTPPHMMRPARISVCFSRIDVSHSLRGALILFVVDRTAPNPSEHTTT